MNTHELHKCSIACVSIKCSNQREVPSLIFTLNYHVKYAM